MNNPFQEQLLKAGLVSKQQVNKVNQEKRKKNKQRPSKKQARAAVNENQLRAQQAAEKKAQRDRELNRKKEEQARNKAISMEINELIKRNKIKRDEKCELAYNFEHQGKVKRLYINEEMKKGILEGKIGIARIDGNYELVPKSVAEKIRERNEKRIVLFDAAPEQVDEDDPYAEYQVPDDLTW